MNQILDTINTIDISAKGLGAEVFADKNNGLGILAILGANLAHQARPELSDEEQSALGIELINQRILQGR